MIDDEEAGWLREPSGRHLRRGVTIFGLLLLTLAARVPAAIPLAIPLAVAWWLAARDRAPHASVTAHVEASGLLEGDEIPLTIAATDLDRRIEVTVAASHHLRRSPRAVSLLPRTPQATIDVLAVHWGPAHVGPAVARAVTASGAIWTVTVPVTSPGSAPQSDGRVALPVHPHIDAMTDTPTATQTMPTPGVHTARVAARGIEFADLRPYAAGDHLRDVNWRASARRGELWVSQRHPEQRQDVVMLLDTFEGSVLPDAVRLSYGLAAAYLGQRDRVGVVGFGGILRWLAPGGGLRHQVRVESALMASQAAVSAAWRDLRIVPPRTLPAHALVVAVTPLREERTFAALTDLLARGRELTVIDVGARMTREAHHDELLARIDRLRRESTHLKLRELGATVVAWEDDETAGAVVARASRRYERARS